MVSIAQWPWMRRDHVAGTVAARGVTRPSPVTTTRRAGPKSGGSIKRTKEAPALFSRSLSDAGAHMAEEVNIMRGYFFMVLVAVQFGFQPLLARLYGSRSSSLGSVVIVGEARSPLLLHACAFRSYL